MPTPSKYRLEFCQIAEEVLSNGRSLAAVCAKINIARCTLYEWRDNNPEFRESISRGLQKCQSYWEEMGIDGIVGNHEKFSPTPWIFTMKNRFRDDYQEDKESKPISDTFVEALIDKLVDK